MDKLKNTFSVREVAKLTQFPLGGEKIFFDWLRFKNYLLSNNEPRQKYIDQKLFVTTIKTIYSAKPPFNVIVTRFTTKGLNYIDKVIKKDFPPSLPVFINNTKAD
jgi:phage antirepressor YoqD-like protein